MTTLVLIRHGESVVTVQRRIGGLRTCSGLTELGRAQVSALADRAVHTGELLCDVLVSSTMPRAIQTAEILAAAAGAMSFEQDPTMCEQDPGECDGMTFDDYVKQFGTPDWGGDPDALVFPGGETVRAFHRRVADGLDALLSRHHGKRVVVACHGGVIDAALRHLLGVPMVGQFELHTFNASVTELGWRPSMWKLVRYNDAAHLHGLHSEPVRVTSGG